MSSFKPGFVVAAQGTAGLIAEPHAWLVDSLLERMA